MLAMYDICSFVIMVSPLGPDNVFAIQESLIHFHPLLICHGNQKHNSARSISAEQDGSSQREYPPPTYIAPPSIPVIHRIHQCVKNIQACISKAESLQKQCPTFKELCCKHSVTLFLLTAQLQYVRVIFTHNIFFQNRVKSWKHIPS